MSGGRRPAWPSTEAAPRQLEVHSGDLKHSAPGSDVGFVQKRCKLFSRRWRAPGKPHAPPLLARLRVEGSEHNETLRTRVPEGKPLRTPAELSEAQQATLPGCCPSMRTVSRHDSSYEHHPAVNRAENRPPRCTSAVTKAPCLQPRGWGACSHVRHRRTQPVCRRTPRAQHSASPWSGTSAASGLCAGHLIFRPWRK